MLVLGTRVASAGTVLTHGAVSIGVFDEGHLAYNVGIHLAGVGDAILPGCDCEGWGVAANGISGFANVGYNEDNPGTPAVSNLTTVAPLVVAGNAPARHWTGTWRPRSSWSSSRSAAPDLRSPAGR